jgi:hypothetical protein
MSSGYSSLEEDSEDFFFTARTSFFRRAPQGKPRAGQQVSDVRPGRCGWLPLALWGSPRTRAPRVCAGRAGHAGRESCRGAQKWLLPFWVLGRSHETLHVGVGRPGREKEEEGRGGWGPRLPSTPDGLCGSASGPPAAESGSESQASSLGHSRRLPFEGARFPASSLALRPFSGQWLPSDLSDPAVSCLCPCSAHWLGTGDESHAGPDDSSSSH